MGVMAERAYLRRRPRAEGEPVGDLLVIQVAKELCLYVVEVTQKSPKQFRFTFTTRLQGMALDILELVFLANGLYIGPDGRPEERAERRALQQKSLTRAQLLAYVAEMACAQNALLPKQFAEIGRLTMSLQRLVGGWITSDARRVPNPAAGRPAAAPTGAPGGGGARRT
jgi:hypothetical protein